MALVDNAWYVDGSTGIAVTDLGSSTTAAAGTTLTLTGVTVPAGALIVVAVNEATATSDGSLSDGGTNTYAATGGTTIPTSAGRTTVFYAWNAVALNNSTLTYTRGSGHVTSMAAFYATGIQTSSDPRDTSFQNTATSSSTAAPTVTSNAPTTAGELVVGVLGHNNAAARTYTQDSTHNFNTPPSANQTNGTAGIGGGHLNVNGSLAATFAPTLSGTAATAALILAFKAANSPVGWWNVTKWAASNTQHCGDIIRQNAQPAIGSERCFVCVASTSGTGTTGSSEPAWTVTRGAKITDNTVTWQEATGVAALNGDLTNTPAWSTVKNTAVTLGQVIKSGDGTKVLICTTAGTAGNGAEPTWATFTNAGATTADNTVTWSTIAAVPSGFAVLAAPQARLANVEQANWEQAGNSVFIADNHSEVQPTTLTITSQGTDASPVSRYSFDHTLGSLPPTSVKSGATIATSGNTILNLETSGASVSYTYGVTFSAGSFNASSAFNLGTSNTAGSAHRFENCAFVLGGTGAQNFSIGNSNEGMNEFYNCTVTFGATSQTININSGTFFWRATASAILGSVPTTLFGSNTGNTLVYGIIDGVDLSALGSGKTLVKSGASLQMTFIRCKLGASVTEAASPSAPGSRVSFVQCDSAGTNYRNDVYAYAATQSVETTITRTGGATDGGQAISWKIVTTGNCSWLWPYVGEPVSIWNDVTGSSITVTIYGIWGSASVPNNDDIWIEAEYLGSASSPLGSFINDTKANNLATGSALTVDSTSTWGGSLSPSSKFTMSVTLTPQMKGPINITIKAAKASSTFYIDPKPVVVGVGTDKSYIVAPGVYINQKSLGISRSRIQTGM